MVNSPITCFFSDSYKGVLWQFILGMPQNKKSKDLKCRIAQTTTFILVKSINSYQKNKSEHGLSIIVYFIMRKRKTEYMIEIKELAIW